ncbi:HNH endonuclease [Bacillus cereus]|uniref:HNH endonuclease n=1 Tax=Bacillus cereus group TaxID=86661 RepID=UPI0007B20342|nr:HNH endonuclease [Bacillus cereus]KZD41248.1 putative toxin component near putative ESAT-related protein repetitive [Bacillus cereus]MCU5051156.1 HNH endonuclease [Bacillus cereus]MCU5061479.1 HNH endonuclease [Bacillus cereus]MCU5149607.1 HNH endonuclease [Bacillus cereus]MCU5190983.1 HNH endonuclease [Bacillus cereus]
MYCVGFIPFNFVLASVKVPVYRTNDNGTLERVGTNVEGWVHGHCIDSNQKIQDEIDSVRASLAEIRGSGGTKGTGNAVHRSEIDEVIKNNYDKDGNLINRSIVPKGYDSVEEFKEVVGLTETYSNTKTKMRLDKNLHISPDEAQFKECTRKLKEAIDSGKISKELFSPGQLAQINAGKARIKGLTWHHHQVPGKMQLVISKVHKVNHLGGNKLWGDGIR